MGEERFDIVYSEEIGDDFIKYKIKENFIIKIHNKLSLHSNRIISISQSVKGTHYKIRKYRFGKYRLFFTIEDYTIYCLGFLHRKDSYKKESINKMITLVREIQK